CYSSTPAPLHQSQEARLVPLNQPLARTSQDSATTFTSSACDTCQRPGLLRCYVAFTKLQPPNIGPVYADLGGQLSLRRTGRRRSPRPSILRSLNFRTTIQRYALLLG